MFPISKVLTGLLGILTVAADGETAFCSFINGALDSSRNFLVYGLTSRER